GVVAWSIPRQVSSSSSVPSFGAVAEEEPDEVPEGVTSRSAEPSRPTGQGGSPRPLCYRAARHADQPREAPAPPARRPSRTASPVLRPAEGPHCHPDPPLRHPPPGGPGGSR